MAPYNTSNSSGLNTPESELESLVGVHPTAARRPHAIVVQSDATSYSDEFITSKFTNRGADVVVQQEGRFLIQPNQTAYDFRTTRKVPKTGYD